MPQKSITLTLIAESSDIVTIEEYYLEQAAKEGIDLRRAIDEFAVVPRVESAIYAGDGLLLSVHSYDGKVISRSLDEVKVNGYANFGVPTYSLNVALKEQAKAYGYLVPEEAQP